MIRPFIPFLAILLAIALYFLHIAPSWENIATLKLQRDEYTTALDRSERIVAERDRLVSKYNSFPTPDIEKLETLLPDSIDIVRLLLDINGIATRYDLEITSVAVTLPEDPEAGSTEEAIVTEDPQRSGGVEAEALAPIEEISYSYADVTFNVDATYEDVQRFLNDLEGSLRLLDIQNIGFAANDEEDVMTYGITVRSYRLQ